MDFGLRDKAFLITGGTDGLGLALARLLVDEGAKVAVCGRDEERVARAAELLGPGSLASRTDVTDAEQLDSFIDATIEKFGRLDGAVNNAGRMSASPIASADEVAWRDDFELKVVSAVHVARRALPELAKTGGSVLNVLAISARAPGSGSTPTAASRAAGLAMTKALAAEGGPLGVRANAILIGFVESGQWVRRAEAAGVELADFYRDVAANAKIPLGRVGRAEEFAQVAAFLLSPLASYVNGVGIAVDGGLSPVV